MLSRILVLISLAAYAPCVTGHYVFSRFIFDKTLTEQWEYVRNVSIGQAVDSGLWDQYMPFYDISSDDVRCGRGASKSGWGTSTAEVFAGDEVGFVVGRSAMEPLEPHVIYHNGPGQAYLSRSTEHDVRDYDGGGNWFKIAYFGALNDTWWSTRDQTGMNFTIPASTPPGQYLLRVEHLYVRYPFGTTQFYIACAQIDVRPPRSAVVERTPSEEYMARFPGAYHLTDEGIDIPEYMYEWPNSRLTEYKPPGPAVWKG